MNKKKRSDHKNPLLMSVYLDTITVISLTKFGFKFKKLICHVKHS